MDIGNRLKELRVLKGLTQEELADRSELSKGFISQLERNLTSPSIATLMDILQCLGTTIGEFFTEEPEEQIVFGTQDYFETVSYTHLDVYKRQCPYSAQKNSYTPDKNSSYNNCFPPQDPCSAGIRPGRGRNRDIPGTGDPAGGSAL